MPRLLVAALLLAASPLWAEGTVKRTELSRADAPGSTTHEVIITRLEIAPGATVPRHFHYGDEHLVVIEGGEMITRAGDRIPFPSGMAARFPAEVAHGGLTNGSDTPMIAITTHVVEKGKPFSVAVD